jgi:polyisoprenoid-binding protein YceI
VRPITSGAVPGAVPGAVRRAVLGVLALICVPAGLKGQEFQVDLQAENTVRFVSRAVIEEFEGVTERIDGFVYLAAPHLESGLGGDGTEFYFEVDLASLDTGNTLRDRHMRDNYLEVREYPYATIEGRLGSVQGNSAEGFQVAIVGALGIHGVSRRVSIRCEAEEEGPGYRVRCAWNVLLSDFDIEIPKVMFLKLANEVRIELDFVLVPITSPDPQFGPRPALSGRTQ